MSTEIYLLRHGETQWNKAKRYQGHLNSDLTKKGRLQAQKMGACLKRELKGNISYSMVCSPLGRTRQTAGIVSSALDFDVNNCAIDDQIIEVTLGDWDGMTHEEVSATYPQEWATYQNDKWHSRPPSGESSAMMDIRARKWLATLTKTPDPLIVVSHGAIGRVIRGVYADMDTDDVLALSVPQDALFRLSNGMIEEIPVEG